MTSSLLLGERTAGLEGERPLVGRPGASALDRLLAVYEAGARGIPATGAEPLMFPTSFAAARREPGGQPPPQTFQSAAPSASPS